MKLIVAFLVMAIAFGFMAPYCGAQGEDAYPRMAPESALSASLPMDNPLPPPERTEAKQGHWWAHMVPSDRAIWLISSIADIGQYAYQEVDTLETAHIKSGKGIREARLAVKMLVGAGATSSLVAEFHKGKRKRGKSGR